MTPVEAASSSTDFSLCAFCLGFSEVCVPLFWLFRLYVWVGFSVGAKPNSKPHRLKSVLLEPAQGGAAHVRSEVPGSQCRKDRGGIFRICPRLGPVRFDDDCGWVD